MNTTKNCVNKLNNWNWNAAMTQKHTKNVKLQRNLFFNCLDPIFFLSAIKILNKEMVTTLI